MDRRTFVKGSAVLVGATVTGVVPRQTAALDASTPRRRSPGQHVRLGVASYSLRNFPLDKAVDMTKSLGTPYINLKSFHLPYEATPAELASARRLVEAAGLQIVGGGLITFDKDTDVDVRKYFEYAKGAGMPLIVASGHPDVMPRVERFVKQYDIKVAIHNHGPEDNHFPSPYDALARVRNMDPRIGLCIDVGHTVRTGTDVVKAISDAGPRLLDMHAKDLRDLKDVNSQCIVGQGVMPIPAIFRQLDAINYAGFVNLEYEIEPENPLPGMLQSFAYMRGVVAGMTA